MKHALFAVLLIAGCKETIQHGVDAALDAPKDGPPADEGRGPPPNLTCTPVTAAAADLCGCMANIVCDQIYYCLTPSQLASKPSDWSPKTACVEALQSDCEEDMNSDPVTYFPSDFRQCITDIGNATCQDFGMFNSVSNDFPASCDNLRALDTGLGINQ